MSNTRGGGNVFCKSLLRIMVNRHGAERRPSLAAESLDVAVQSEAKFGVMIIGDSDEQA